MFWIDHAKGILYVDGYLQYNQHRDNVAVFGDSLFEYNLTTQEWKAIGRLNSKFSDQERISNLCETPEGLFVRHFNTTYFISFTKNSVIPISEKLSNSLYLFYDHEISGHGFTQRDLTTFYARDTLYLVLGNNTNYTVTKFKITNKDFQYGNAEVLYTSYSSWSRFLRWAREEPLWLYTVINFFLIALLITIVLLRRRKSDGILERAHASQDVDSKTLPVVAEQIPAFIDKLSNIEKQLVEQLIKHSINHSKMSISAVNKILGTSQKDLVTQKTRRSSVINNVNEIYSSTFKDIQYLIEREKDLMDRRSNSYFIENGKAEVLKKYFM
jgi:hypothetical protein